MGRGEGRPGDLYGGEGAVYPDQVEIQVSEEGLGVTTGKGQLGVV